MKNKTKKVSGLVLLVLFVSMLTPLVSYSVGDGQQAVLEEGSWLSEDSSPAEADDDGLRMAGANESVTASEDVYSNDGKMEFDPLINNSQTFNFIETTNGEPSTYNTLNSTAPGQTFTGFPDDWLPISYNEVSSYNDLIHLKAVQRGNKLFLHVKGNHLQNDNTFYIDSDHNSATGYSMSLWSDAAGIDYKLTDHSLYKYENGNWVYVSEVAVMASATVFEAEIDIGDMGLQQSGWMKVAFGKTGNRILPGSGMSVRPAMSSMQRTRVLPSMPIMTTGKAFRLLLYQPISRLP